MTEAGDPRRPPRRAGVGQSPRAGSGRHGGLQADHRGTHAMLREVLPLVEPQASAKRLQFVQGSRSAATWRAMAGDVTVTSVPGEGSTFTRTLPRAPEGALASAGTGAPPRAAP